MQVKKKMYEKPTVKKVQKNSLVFKLIEKRPGFCACRQCSSCHDCN